LARRATRQDFVFVAADCTLRTGFIRRAEY
jgi:hypothetical protein